MILTHTFRQTETGFMICKQIVFVVGKYVPCAYIPQRNWALRVFASHRIVYPVFILKKPFVLA